MAGIVKKKSMPNFCTKGKVRQGGRWWSRKASQRNCSLDSLKTPLTYSY